MCIYNVYIYINNLDYLVSTCVRFPSMVETKSQPMIHDFTCLNVVITCIGEDFPWRYAKKRNAIIDTDNSVDTQ